MCFISRGDFTVEFVFSFFLLRKSLEHKLSPGNLPIDYLLRTVFNPLPFVAKDDVRRFAQVTARVPHEGTPEPPQPLGYEHVYSTQSKQLASLFKPNILVGEGILKGTKSSE